MKKKKILLVTLTVLVVALVSNYQLLYYAYVQAAGQMRVLRDAMPIEEALSSDQFPDSLKIKLRLVEDIRKFAIDSLCLHKSDNYTTVYNQNGKSILWVVVASKPFEIIAEEWSFPIIGSFPYRGFFDWEMLQNEKQELDTLGLDTHVNEVSGWSTLGWFSDPILSKMLQRSEGALANLIIHELTHATVFVPDSSVLNENLATFVADVGARKFLQSKYGKESQQMKDYLGYIDDRKKFAEHMLAGSQYLDSVYRSFEHSTTDIDKFEVKRNALIHVFRSLDSISFHDSARFVPYIEYGTKANNAFFVSYKTYQSKQSEFQRIYNLDFAGDYERFIEHIKDKYEKAGLSLF